MRAFSLIELLVTIAIVVLLVALTLPTLSASRREGRKTICISNMKQAGVLSSAYSTEHRDIIHGYSWQVRKPPPVLLDPDLLTIFLDRSSREITAGVHAVQAVDLLRKQTGATVAEMPGFTGWMINGMFSHLPLTSWAGTLSAAKGVWACPEHRQLIQWANEATFLADTDGWRNGSGQPNPSSRWFLRYMSSYKFTSSAYADDSNVNVHIPQGGHHAYPMAGSSPARLGHRKYTEVSFPSQKVLLFDEQDRHSSRRQMWYAERQAKQPLLMFDGSAAVRATADANPGWHPHFPQAMQPSTVDKFSNQIFNFMLRVEYRPQRALAEAPALKSSLDPTYPPFYWYTRGGLKGVDFASPDINTSNWTSE